MRQPRRHTFEEQVQLKQETRVACSSHHTLLANMLRLTIDDMTWSGTELDALARRRRIDTVGVGGDSYAAHPVDTDIAAAIPANVLDIVLAADTGVVAGMAVDGDLRK